MRTITRFQKLQTAVLSVPACAAFLLLLWAPASQAFPISQITFKDDAPFKGTNGVHSLTSGDGLLTVAAWGDTNATASANLYQWWWILGVDSGVGNVALLDGQESVTFEFYRSVGCSHICFLYTGDQTSPSTPAQITISGFLSDPGAYATTYVSPLISNLSYSGGILTFDYLYDSGTDYGQLLFANPAASRGQKLTITYSGASWGAGLFRVDSQELFGGPVLQPVSVKYNFTNAYTTPDGGLTARGYSDRNATVPANFGTYVDQCFGVSGGVNNGAIDTDESVTLQFAPGFGLSRFDGVFSSGQVTISGFLGDPGFTDNLGGSFGVTYADGVLSFYPMDGGHHAYFFTNRTASAGRTLKVTVDPGTGFQFAIAGIGYANLQTLLGSDIPSNVSPSYTTADGILTLNAYSDTPGTVAANLYENVDWFGVAGGNNNEAIDGTESLSLRFSGGAGLSAVGTRYTSGQVVISGFASDPGFTDPSGTATGVSYSGGTLRYTFNQYHAAELVVAFTHPSASAGRTLSMHTDGNSGSQIALTRIGYAMGPVTLSISKVSSDVVLTWPTGTLQQGTNVTGIYSDLSGATSPYTNAVSGMPRYFRVRVQ